MTFNSNTETGRSPSAGCSKAYAPPAGILRVLAGQNSDVVTTRPAPSRNTACSWTPVASAHRFTISPMTSRNCWLLPLRVQDDCFTCMSEGEQQKPISGVASKIDKINQQNFIPFFLGLSTTASPARPKALVEASRARSGARFPADTMRAGRLRRYFGHVLAALRLAVVAVALAVIDL